MPRLAGDDSWISRSRQFGTVRWRTSASARSRGIERQAGQINWSLYQGPWISNERTDSQIGQIQAAHSSLKSKSHISLVLIQI